MRFHVFSLIGIAFVFSICLASCGEMELPTAPLEKEEASDSEATNSEATVPEVSPSGEDSPTSSDHTPPPSEAITVATLPTPCSIWRDHVVALSVPIGSSSTTPEALVTLISLYDWSEVPSALNESSPTVAATIAQGYQEYDLTNWRIPTAAEAKALKAACTPPQSKGTVLGSIVCESSSSSGTVLGDSVCGSPSTPSFESLNALLLALEASELHLTDGATNVRYLCEDATRTFSFVPGTTISAAGTKATNYRLRLIKTLRLKLKQ